MLKRIEVTEPPNRAPQYMVDRRMIADTGCIPNVRGRSSETPLGAPSPGSTHADQDPKQHADEHQPEMRKRDCDGEPVQQGFDVVHRILVRIRSCLPARHAAATPGTCVRTPDRARAGSPSR